MVVGDTKSVLFTYGVFNIQNFLFILSVLTVKWNVIVYSYILEYSWLEATALLFYQMWFTH